MDDVAGFLTESIFNRERDVHPLHAAASHGQADQLQTILLGSPNQAVNWGTFDSSTPLHEACQAGSVSCVGLLLRHGAKVNARNIDGATPLCHACSSGNVKCVQLLLQNGAEVNPSLNLLTSPLHEAVSYEQLAVVEILLQNGAKIETSDLHYGTALHVAAIKDNWKITTALLLAGANANAAKNHTTALHIAANINSLRLSQILLEFGANIYARSLWGKTAKDMVEKEHGKGSALYQMLSLKEAEPKSLMVMCRTRIRQLVGRHRLPRIPSLPLPTSLNNFVAFAQLDVLDIFKF